MLYGSCSTKRAPRILKNKWVLHILVGWIVANQNKSVRIRTLNILKTLYTGCSTKDAIKLLLLRNTKVSREITFTHSLWVNGDKSKEMQLELGYCSFWNCYIQGTPRWSNITAPFAEHLKFQDQMTFMEAFWVNSGTPKHKKNRISTLCILKLLHTGCSTKDAITLLLSRSN